METIQMVRQGVVETVAVFEESFFLAAGFTRVEDAPAAEPAPVEPVAEPTAE